MTEPTYVSRLPTDRAMEHARLLGIPPRVGQKQPPARAKLEAGIATPVR